MKTNNDFLNKAAELTPVLLKRKLTAEGSTSPLSRHDTVLMDFGEHLVGYVTLNFSYTGSHPDAPVLLRLRFAERLTELSESLEDYHGWVCSSWVQQEQIHVDIIPGSFSLPRRYAFRYLHIEVLDISDRFRLLVNSAECTAVSSADFRTFTPYASSDEESAALDSIACRTLHECMQLVFEDGPKRDRRLWMGDLYLQALSDYQTFRNYDLVKRCLYLFAGSTLSNGQISASIFTEPEPCGDDMGMFDYSLLFIPALLDLYQETGDMTVLKELWPTAWRQIELSQDLFDDADLVRDSDTPGWCFVDWNLSLNRQASAQGIYLYCLKAAEKIAGILNDTERSGWIADDISKKQRAALKFMFDQELGVFISGPDRQISWASQIWMILGGVFFDGSVFDRLKELPATGMNTPYMYHYYVQALIDLGKKDAALKVIKDYWGGMLKAGADTFWEMFDPENPDESPYGGTIVNSYCHAWSCTPAYFLRKYFS